MTSASRRSLALRVLLRLTFDKDRKGSLEDICTVHGFARALQLVLRTARFGLLHAGQPCNSFSWMSSASHARCDENGYMGRTDQEWIKVCNVIAVRCAICLMVAFSRRVLFIIENPRQSVLPYFPYFKYVLELAELLDKHALGYSIPKHTTWCLVCSHTCEFQTILKKACSIPTCALLCTSRAFKVDGPIWCNLAKTIVGCWKHEPWNI